MACNDNIESSQGDISGIIEPPKLQNVRKRKAKSAKDTLFISPKKARTIPGSSLVSQKSSAENDGKNKKSSSSDIRDKSGDIVSIDPADALNTRSDRKATAVKSSKPELDKQAEGPLTVKPQKRTGRPQKKTSGAEEEAEPVSDRWRAVLQKVRKLEIKSKRGEVREPIELLLRKHGPDTKYGKNLRNLSQALLSEEDTYTLEEIAKRRTNGGNTDVSFEPAADQMPQHCSSPCVSQMRVGPTKLMLGRHLLWYDTIGDEWLSWSRSLLFAIEHAIGRHYRNEKHIYIAMIDTLAVKSVYGDQVEFYPALDLYRAFQVPFWDGWSSPNRIGLHPRKFTHEYLSHGSVLVDGEYVRHIPLADLRKDGLFDMFPEMEIPDGLEYTGLYTRLVALRAKGFPPSDISAGSKSRTTLNASDARSPRDLPGTSDPGSPVSEEGEIVETEDEQTTLPAHIRLNNDPPLYSYNDRTPRVPFTTETLERYTRWAKGWFVSPNDERRAYIKAPLHGFLCFLALVKRPRRDPVFMKWIKQRYTTRDMTWELFDEISHVADNLPEVMQYLDLVRDACEALGVTMIPDNVIAHKDPLTKLKYEEDDATMQKHAEMCRFPTSTELYARSGREEKRGNSKEAESLRIQGMAAQSRERKVAEQKRFEKKSARRVDRQIYAAQLVTAADEARKRGRLELDDPATEASDKIEDEHQPAEAESKVNADTTVNEENLFVSDDEAEEDDLDLETYE